MAESVCRLAASCLFFLLGMVFFGIPVQAYATLSDETLKSLPRPNNDFNIRDGALLAPILQPRVPGTLGSLQVLQHFVNFFRTTLPEWTIEFQNSTSKTPVTGNKEIPFVNLIAFRDPPWSGVGDTGRFTLAAHYDSKREPPGFIGATDSAAPCAIIMHSIRSIDAALTKKWDAMKAESSHDSFFDHQGIQVFLLDGEEAFHSWTDIDSLYGSRALAQAMEDTFYPATSVYKSPLSAISLFVLLDLLGEKDPQIPSHFKTTHWAYQNMATLETRLRQLGLFKSAPSWKKGDKLWLPDSEKEIFFPSGIADDHIPFMRRGVEILHLIASPFPKTWHKITDDAEHLDLNTVEDWSTLLTAFIAEWLELEGVLPKYEGSVDEPNSRKTEL
ncbi:glutaminyl-peptide cyclotransferase [Histoplasma capsulatum G186AR]|uniref:Peptide hydrolase n=1 Tax=Ajellomyces capsulatus (strain G186AR / H82 / ATCC MYA-2454 / RMSCC 2432) TaxID=447093 RepID=C0NUM9_AJECG|nr:glutaminyl-peptide cyclotransferase [Histoplasma capsulatum G186AR]EEH05109.1 glutaminyl-peptide cyclotransferase [Histoplasma capsulatum G186AR]